MKNKHLKNNSKSNRIILVIRIILIIIIIICLYKILSWHIENQKNARILADVADSSIIDTITIQVPSEDGSEESTDVSAYEINFESLLSANNSTVGWLTVPNTSINYPVVQAQDNNFYLNHSFDKTPNSAGWIFADYRNKFDGTDKNIIIYGHNRKDSSMFATLKNTQKSDWYSNAENRYLTFSTPTNTDVYEIFSVYTTPAEDYYITTNFNTPESYLNFLNTLKSRSITNFGVSLNPEDQILTLSTCDATGRARVILHARRVYLHQTP